MSLWTQAMTLQLRDVTGYALLENVDAASADGKRIADAVRRSLGEDGITQYLARLQTDFGATINQAALRQVVSGGSGDRN